MNATLFARSLLGASALALTLVGESRAQSDDDRPPDIEVGSSRIGGPGTQAEQEERAAALVEEDEEVITEETLPPKGNKKRLPGLHTIARRYVGGHDWITACDRYDQIIDEGGEEALDLVPDGKANAAKSYLRCGEAEIPKANFDKAERQITKSEKWGGKNPRTEALRRKVARERYRREMMQGNVDQALAGFKAYQSEKADEDERIWMGSELTRLAVEAQRAKDKVRMEEMIRKAQEVAPMNPELRAMVEKLENEKNAVKNAMTFSALVIGAIAAFGLLAKLRSITRLKVSKFDD